MAENTNTEREAFEKWALENRLGEYIEQMGFRFFDAGDGYPSWKAWQARASLPAAGQEPVGYWDGEFSSDGGATLYEVPQVSAFGRKYRNAPLYAAPQPAVAAGWVSVDERLPEPNVEVLCAGQGWGNAYVTACYYDDERREWYPANTHWTDATGCAQYPTHWQPLPLPPAPSTEGERR